MGFHSIMVKVGGSMLPLFTARSPPILSDSIFFLPITSTRAPLADPISFTVAASFSALSAERGSLTISRHLNTASRIMFRFSASSFLIACAEIFNSFRLNNSFFLSFLYLINWYDDSPIPSTKARIWEPFPVKSIRVALSML